MDRGKKQRFELKTCFEKHAAFCFTKRWLTWVMWITCELLWCFYQLFGLSFWRHPFTAEDPLVSKWCNAKFLQICFDEQTKSSTSMAWGWANFHFCVNYSFKLKMSVFPFHPAYVNNRLSVYTKCVCRGSFQVVFQCSDNLPLVQTAFHFCLHCLYSIYHYLN